MTKEEIESHISAELDRRLAHLTAQFGRDLSERYLSKDQVEETIQARLKEESDTLEKALNAFAEEVETKDIHDADHPFSFLIQVLEDIGNLQNRVMELGMYILAEEVEIERGPETMGKMMRVARIKTLTVKHERQRFREHAERLKGRTKDPDKIAALDDLVELIGNEPKPGGARRPN